MKKRWICFLLVIAMMLFLPACKPSDDIGDDTAGDQGESNTDAPVLRTSLREYTILYSSSATEYEQEAARLLRTELGKLFGTLPQMLSDSKVRNSEDSLEILVGDTNRAQSDKALWGVSDVRFVIREYGTKLVVQATNDTLLTEAVNTLLTQFLSPEGELISSTPLDFISDSQPHHGIVSGGKMGYSILYSRDMISNVMTETAKQISVTLRELTGLRAPVEVAGQNVSADEPTILLGRIAGSEVSERLWQSLAPNEYGIFIEGGQIYLIGKTDLTTRLAVERFCRILRNSVEKGEGDAVSINFCYQQPIRGVCGDYAVSYPVYPSGELRYTDCANATLMCMASGTNIQEYEAYQVTLREAGFAVEQSYGSGANRFATYADESTVLTVNYLDADHTVRIFSTPRENAYLTGSGEPITTDRVTDSTLTVKALHYDTQKVNIGNNGLAMIYTLSDGSFLIYDGGNADDADSLYQWLTENNHRPDGKIVIAAWVITHSHGDHYGCFKQFSQAYGKQVTLEAAVASPALLYRYEDAVDDDFLTSAWESCVKRFAGNPKLIVPHMGQRLSFRNAVVEIMMTTEDFTGHLIRYGNESCMVSRVHLNGTSVLMLGDSENEPIDWLIRYMGTALKSDVIQVPHHGNSGGTQKLYDAVAADIAIFATSAESYKKYTAKGWNGGANYYLITEIVRQSYHAGDTVTLQLPL